MMKLFRVFLCFSCITVLNSVYAEPPSKETGILSPEVGFEDKESGARVDSVGILTDEGVQRIEVSVPTEEQPIEEVIVYGKRQEEIWKIPQFKGVEIVNNLETGRSGVVIHVGKNQPFVLKFNYFEPESYEGQKQFQFPKSNANY